MAKKLEKVDEGRERTIADERTDADGRVLYPWEVSPEDHVYAVQVDESSEARAAREAQVEHDERAAAAELINAPAGDEQPVGTVPDFD